MGLFRKTLNDAEKLFSKYVDGKGTEADAKEGLKILRGHIFQDLMGENTIRQLAAKARLYEESIKRVVLEMHEAEAEKDLSKSVVDSLNRLLKRTRDETLKEMETLTKQLMERELAMG